MAKVMAEVKGISEALGINKVHVLYWDGVVQVHEEYDAVGFKDWVNTTKPVGGGGTTPACVPDYLRDKGITPEVVIMLTDGDVNGWGVWNVPVLWVVANSNKIVAPVGKTIHLGD
jgi:predicted metal-dependent peptidase